MGHRLTFAAVMRDGEIITGKRHSDCIIKAVRYADWRPPVTQAEQGFVDEEGIFYTREDAVDIAVEASQISAGFKGILLSEDLW